MLAGANVQGGENAYGARDPLLDAHGRRVAFSSDSYDLVPNDSYDTSHTYVRYLR